MPGGDGISGLSVKSLNSNGSGTARHVMRRAGLGVL